MTRGAIAAALLAAACAAPAPRTHADRDGARAALEAFSAAVAAERWDEAYALLSARWRARETPARLAGDLAASGPVGRDALGRVRALLAAGAPLSTDGDSAALPVGSDRAARLLLEGGAWRVDALE
jgi:hypothetical protein